MSPIFKPLVLIFDLDETTHTCYATSSKNRTPMYGPNLSLSTKDLLLRTPNEKYQLDTYIDSKTNSLVTVTLHTIAPDKFKEIFKKIYSVRKKYGEQCPIAVKIITRGDYKEKEIKRAWNNFYGGKNKEFTKNLLPVEFFNRFSLKKDGKPLPDDVDEKELLKEELIDEYFPKWQKELPGLEKSRVYIIDDNYETTQKVEALGFSAIHFPTVTTTRPEGRTFTKEGSEAFITIHKLIESAVPSVQIEIDDESEEEITHETTNHLSVCHQS